MAIPTWGEYEKKCNHPITEAEYVRYIKLNFKHELEKLDNSEES